MFSCGDEHVQLWRQIHLHRRQRTCLFMGRNGLNCGEEIRLLTEMNTFALYLSSDLYCIVWEHNKMNRHMHVQLCTI